MRHAINPRTISGNPAQTSCPVCHGANPDCHVRKTATDYGVAGKRDDQPIRRYIYLNRICHPENESGWVDHEGTPVDPEVVAQ